MRTRKLDQFTANKMQHNDLDRIMNYKKDFNKKRWNFQILHLKKTYKNNREVLILWLYWNNVLSSNWCYNNYAS